jgi:hypothetical protein
MISDFTLLIPFVVTIFFPISHFYNLYDRIRNLSWPYQQTTSHHISPLNPFFLMFHQPLFSNSGYCTLDQHLFYISQPPPCCRRSIPHTIFPTAKEVVYWLLDSFNHRALTMFECHCPPLCLDSFLAGKAYPCCMIVWRRRGMASSKQSGRLRLDVCDYFLTTCFECVYCVMCM